MDLTFEKEYNKKPYLVKDSKMREESLASIVRLLRGEVEVRKDGELYAIIPNSDFFLKKFGKSEKDVENLNGNKIIYI